MWFYLGVLFPQDSSFPNYIHLTTNLPTAHCLPIYISSSLSLLLTSSLSLSLHCPTPTLQRPHCATHYHFREHTHTRQPRWVAWSLSDRWIGKYLPSQIVFLPRSSLHPSTHRLPLYTSVPHSSVCSLLSFFRVLLSQWSRLHLIVGASHRHLLCKHACIHMHVFWIYDEEDDWMCIETYTHMYGRVRASANKELIIIVP